MSAGSVNVGLVRVHMLSDHGAFVPHPEPVLPRGAEVMLLGPTATGAKKELFGVIARVVGPNETDGPVRSPGYLIELCGEEQIKPIPATATPAPPADDSQPRVLVVEDDRVLGRLVTAWLSRIGWRTELVAQGCKALELVQTNKPLFALVIVDSLLPDTVGERLIRQIRGLTAVPIVSTSGVLVKKEAQNAVLGAGANRFLSKPFGEKDFCRTVLELVGYGGNQDRRARRIA